jgi:hypothetical protein
MSLMKGWRFSILMIGVSGVLIAESAQATMIEIEMTSEQVIAQRGKPDRVAILEGKLLRVLALEEAVKHLAKNKVVFIYDKMQEYVWFHEGRVVGVTEYGLAAPKDDRQAPDQGRIPGRDPQALERFPREQGNR